MTDKRAFYGGLAFIAGGIPILVFYGISLVGSIGLGLIILGALIAYGATVVDQSSNSQLLP